MMWGKHKENGLWISKSSDWRLMLRGHDALYVAAGRLRLRLMKPPLSRPELGATEKTEGNQ